MSRARTIGLVALIAAAALLGAARDGTWRWDLPAGVKPPVVPADNAMSAARVELGRRLFYDADLSIDGTMACSTCHEQHRAFADGNRTHAGVHGDPGRRNVPGLANIAWIRPLTWGDPRLRTLEAQILVPVFGEKPVEMGMKGSEAEIEKRLGKDACYRRMFAEAYPAEQRRIDMVSVAKALAAFERTMISYDSGVDRYRRGETDDFPREVRAGAALFDRRCASCHAGANYTDGRFHALGEATGEDGGLADVSGKARDRGRFRTAPLRNVALTGPYLHDGSAATIEQAIMRHGQIAALLSAEGRAALLAFLGQLTDRGFVKNPKLAYPESFCGKPS